MPLAMIEIEQLESNRWHASMEAGFPVCRKEELRGTSFEDIIQMVAESYFRLMPDVLPAPRGGEVVTTPPVEEPAVFADPFGTTAVVRRGRPPRHLG